MVLLGLGLLIASVSFLCYKHAPAGWWTFLERLTLRAGNSIQNGDSNRDSDADGKGNEGKREDSTRRIIGVEEREKAEADRGEKSSTSPSSSSSSSSNYKINAPTQKSTTTPTTNAPAFQISEPSQFPSIQPPSPPPNKAALDRAAMPPPPPLFKKPSSTPKPKPQTPTSPTTPRAHASQPSPTPQIPIFSLDATNSTSSPSDLESESEPEIPSFPAANSAQRASNTGSRAPPRLNPLPAFKSTSTPTPSTLSAPARGPLPNRSPLPNRNPSSSLAAPSLAPPPTHTSIPSKPRKKVLLTPNHSPLDWARLTSSPTSNLRNLPPSTPLLRVPPSLLKQFTGRKGKDAWTVLGGKVYNITPYLPYHPGGEPELLKCAGRDGTRLFGEVHPWVNWEGMLEACLVGISVGEEEFEGVGGLEDMD
ncbi:uncharacterized protein EAE97_007322 [Botrytis byssoidea]|uniref:Cytochrome b5 heme-binding domain-containing protein n=1 Tax=Botrytis byssoidea TaxID=139641 RepID=A0A9P5INI4_9HELO|nr:uncharacterized protein EAE97_007322 [Botrytis byssoidea]KAF7939242.1 hypothetical protein EAE97_007322 [Botrytis byssoidea]